MYRAAIEHLGPGKLFVTVRKHHNVQTGGGEEDSAMSGSQRNARSVVHTPKTVPSYLDGSYRWCGDPRSEREGGDQMRWCLSKYRVPCPGGAVGESPLVIVNICHINHKRYV